jgi:hypothetical protein
MKNLAIQYVLVAVMLAMMANAAPTSQDILQKRSEQPYGGYIPRPGDGCVIL